MANLSFWAGGHRRYDHKFLDRAVSEWFGISGTAMYVHKYMGVHDQTKDGSGFDSVTTVQDMLYLENRDRKYGPNIYELRCVYNVGENDIDMKQFGAFLSVDNLFVYIHMNDMFNIVGRRIMSGDVIELPHQRDDMLLDSAAPAINKFYVVDDAAKASEGFQQNWFPLVWRLKCRPMTGAQEYQDILDLQSTNIFNVNTGKLGDIITVADTDLDVNAAIVADARTKVSSRYFETRQFYVMPGDVATGQNPWVSAGDGIPPNGSTLLGSGTSFPEVRYEGDYFLRTDYFPHALYLFAASAWRMQERNYRQSDWSAASRILDSFINNNVMTKHVDGTTSPEKQGLYTAIKPQADF